MGVLIHISQQLNNSTIPAYAPAKFTISPNAAAVNAFFFLSLALVLTDAFLAMLIKSWLREFERGWKKHNAAHLRAQERERLVQGLERWKLRKLVTILPFLIQLSLLSFCIGLLVLVFPIHLASAIWSLLALITGSFILTTYAPFSSPVSHTLTTLINALRTTCGHLVARNTWRNVLDISIHTSRPLPPQGHQPGEDSRQETTLHVNNVVAHPAQPQGHEGVEKKEVVTRSRFQVDPQADVDILERLVTTTTEAVENIPIFLELLDQPVKDLTLWPFNVEKWTQLLHTTLELLGDPSTISDSIACTIARTMLFCYSHETVDQRLYQRLQRVFDIRASDKTGAGQPFNPLFSSQLHFQYFHGQFKGVDHWRTMCGAIACLQPSSAADAELLWMVNTIPRIGRLQQAEYLEYFAAVLTYVVSTEQSRRSQVPLTAAVIHAMHTIKSAHDQNAMDSIHGLYILPINVLTSESGSTTFHKVDGIDVLDPWSDDSVGFASALLQPHSHWSEPWAPAVSMFQLPLIAALYIDSTEREGHASTFATILKLIDIPNISLDDFGWTAVYDHTKLAGYWYMILFHEPLYQQGIENYAFQDIGYVIIQTIRHRSEIKLSSLHLLDSSVKHLCATASPSSVLLARDDDDDGNLKLSYALPDGPISHYASGPFNPWILLHLDTRFAQASIFDPMMLGELEWIDTPELVHIAAARLALYDSLGEGDHRQLEPDPELLKLFLSSGDYEVCTSAFKWSLRLVGISQSNAVGGADGSNMFIPESMGDDWIEGFIQSLCANDMDRSWLFLAEHLVPKWPMLPTSWCYDFASAFLFSNVHHPDMHELPPYQCFAEALRDGRSQTDHPQSFLSFLSNMLELFRSTLTLDQLTSIESWLDQLPEILYNPQVFVQMEKLLATRKEQFEVAERLDFFAELPMAD